MDFFRSVFVDEPDPLPPASKAQSSPTTSTSSLLQPLAAADAPDQGFERRETTGGGSSAAAASAWSFGGLIKTFSARSESVIETYRRDLKEFGSGLKKETEVLREVASRAVKDLPASIEIGASKAHESLESVTHAIDSIGSTVWKSTAEIIAQGKESLLLHPDLDSDSSDAGNSSSLRSRSVINSGRYSSRYETQLRAIQSDVNSYVDEPEDLDNYVKWKSGFDLSSKTEEVESIIRENATVGSIYERVVPGIVDHVGFWSRYYYRVHRLQQAEFLRVNLVKRAIVKDDEEELSWDVDDDEGEEENRVEAKDEDANSSTTAVALEANSTSAWDNLTKEKVDGNGSFSEVEGMTSGARAAIDKNKHEADQGEGNTVGLDEGNTAVLNTELLLEANPESSNNVSSEEPIKDIVSSAEKTEPSGSGKDSDVSVISSQPSPEEEDLGWDEIEDIGSGDDEKKMTHIGSPVRADVQKRLSTADGEVEDLTWDIEDDDDEPVKA